MQQDIVLGRKDNSITNRQANSRFIDSIHAIATATESTTKSPSQQGCRDCGWWFVWSFHCHVFLKSISIETSPF
jgi:hypothetical protein